MSKKEKQQEPELEIQSTQEPEQTPSEENAPETSPETAPEVTVEQTPQINWEEKYNAEHDTYLRLAAEFDNFRKRTIKEKEASYGNGKSDAVSKLLPIYDILERAVNQPTEDAAYKKGVELTMTELVKIFTGLGVEIFGQPGDSFDPALHNAVMHVEDEELGENVVAEEFLKGYMYKDTVIRHSMVKVAN